MKKIFEDYVEVSLDELLCDMIRYLMENEGVPFENAFERVTMAVSKSFNIPIYELPLQRVSDSIKEAE